METANEYIDRINAQLKEWHLRIADLELKALHERAERKVEIYRQIDGLKKKIEDGRRKLEELTAAAS